MNELLQRSTELLSQIPILQNIMWVNKIGFYCGQTVKDKNVQSSGENKNYNFVCVCPNKKEKKRAKVY